MMGFDLVNLKQWRFVKQTSPPHREPLFNTISGRLPPTSKMVEAGRTYTGYGESIEKRRLSN